MLVGIGAVGLALQVLSAACVVQVFDAPNASTRLARRLATHGEFAVVTSGDAPGNTSPLGTLRAYHLPAEPLLQAAAFTWLPPAAWPYLHVPVTLVFVLGVAVAGWTIAGERGALVAGSCAAFDPFVFVHGPVWDDALLAAALDWSIVAGVLLQARGRARTGGGKAGWTRAFWILLAGLAAVAALTRTASQVFLVGFSVALILVPNERGARRMAAAILAGCLIAIGAWGARNAIVVGTFVTGSTHDGKTLFESVYRTARPEIVRTGVAQDFNPAEAPMLAEAVGLGEAAVDRFYRREALAYMAAHPGDVGRTALFKLAVSLTGIDLGRPLTSARNVVAAGFNLILIVLAGWGWRRWWRAESERGGREAAMRAVLGPAALILTVSTVVLLALGPVGLRYRISFSGLLYVGVAMLTVPRRHPPGLASPPSPHPAHLPG